MIPARVPLIKSVASIITIGTGGLAGQEEPIAQIGSGFGSYLARVLKLPSSERRILMLAGATAGIGAIFRAPLGAHFLPAKFSIPPRPSKSAALLPCLASSIMAYSTFALFITPKPIFSLPDLSFQGLRDLPLRGTDPALRGLRLALRPRLLRFEGQALLALAHPAAAQTGRWAGSCWVCWPWLARR